MISDTVTQFSSAPRVEPAPRAGVVCMGSMCRGSHDEWDPCQSSDAQVRTVLLIDDEILVRFDVAEVLREAGMCAIEASNADEAMEHPKPENP